MNEQNYAEWLYEHNALLRRSRAMRENPPPLEIRQYLRKVTLEEIASGVEPMRVNLDKSIILYHPPVLQWRYRANGQWSDWFEVGYAREE